MDDATLLRHLRASLAGSWMDCIAQGSPGAHVVSWPGVRGAVCPAAPDRSLPNCAIAASADALAAAYDELAAHYDAQGVRAWTVLVTESDVAAAGLLADRGHVLDAVPRAMGRELGDDLPRPPADLDLDEAPGAAVLAEINDTAYDEPLAVFGPALTRYPANADLLAVRVGGEHVSCGFVLDGGVDAHVSGMATLAPHRRRGLAAGVLSHLMARAAARGRRTTTLIATRAGAPVYARLGYRDVGGIEMWERRRLL